MSSPPVGNVDTTLFVHRGRRDETASPTTRAVECEAAADAADLPVARSDHEARFALPGGGGVHVALLFDGDSLDGARALAELGRSARVGWCALLSPIAIDVAQARDVGRWFGLQGGPALVAIWDGAVLAIEYDFDPRALQSLAAAAVKRYRQLEPG